MQRNSTTLFLISPGATTPIPWVNDAPDFSAFTEPTLSVLINSWQTFVNSGQELEVIADPEPIPEPEPTPDWNQFYDGLIMSSTYNHLLQLTAVAPNITGTITAIAVAIVQGQLDPSNPNRLAALQAAINAVLVVLTIIEQPLTTGQLAEVRGLLDSNGFESVSLG
jgi:hypothetical protein